jgi:hypothetical protein
MTKLEDLSVIMEEAEEQNPMRSSRSFKNVLVSSSLLPSREKRASLNMDFDA